VNARDYAAIAAQYTHDVVAGVLAACKWTILACRRQLEDLERQETADFPFRYEAHRGARVCRFIELMPHIKGKWAGKPIRLEAWQIFIVMTVFSWVWATSAHADASLHEKDGLRRFRVAYDEVPRKNAKSTLSSGVGNFMFALDGEGGAECYSAATTKDQAKIVWGDARQMALKSPEFCRRASVEVTKHALTISETASKFVPLAAEDNSLDGLNIHFVAVDEFHAHKTRGLYDVLETATGARTQSLMWLITTAGTNRAGICYEIRTYLTKILERTVVDDTFFGVIWSIDDGDDWTDPKVWAKANPNFGVSVFPDDIARLCRKAQETPSAQPNFLTKRLNVWVNADSPWMDMRAWDRAADPSLSLEQFAGEPCIVAVDLASKLDVACTGLLFRRAIASTNVDGETKSALHYYAFVRHYLPEETIETADNSQYEGWERAGRMIATSGNVIDYDRIQDDLRADRERFDIRELAYDPFQATQFSTQLAGEGFPAVEMGQTVKNFSDPMKELEALVLAGRFHHDGCPVLAWMVSNVVCHVDAKENVFPRKQTTKNKIDGPVTLIMALGRWVATATPERSVYEDDGVMVL
jgi:phage terminase large subunit-like protein